MKNVMAALLLAVLPLMAVAEQLSDDEIAAQFMPPAFDAYKSTHPNMSDYRSWSITSVDLDNTGRQDYLAIAYYNNLIAILRVIRKGNPPALVGESSATVTCDLSPSVETVDLDGNHKPELALNCGMGNEGVSSASLFKWTGTGIVSLNPPNPHRPNAWMPIRDPSYVDLDGNGKLAVIENTGYPPQGDFFDERADVYRLVNGRLVKAPIGLAYYQIFVAGGTAQEGGNDEDEGKQPVPDTDQFVAAPGAYTLTVVNGDREKDRVDKATITLNGKAILSDAPISDDAHRAQISVTLSAQNTIAVQLSGKAGSYISVVMSPASPETSTDLTPRVTCVAPSAQGAFVVHFGYDNANDTTVERPVGTANRFDPPPQDRGQPTTFKPGRQKNVFTVTTDKPLTWILGGKSVTASKDDWRRCDSH